MKQDQSQQVNRLTRREFLGRSTQAAVGIAAGGALAAKTLAAPAINSRIIGANDRIVMAGIGIRSRGKGVIESFARHDNVEVKTLCDIDKNLFADRVKDMEKIQGKAPGTEQDLRRVYDDKDIDAVNIATTNHWHSLATIWACQAGKDVYVEKPGSHNIWEGRKMVETARKYNRVVQHGTQIRSSVAIREAIDKIREGVIGEVYMARGLCYRWRPSIGKYPDGQMKKGEDFSLLEGGKPDFCFDRSYMKNVDYDIWLGPAPKRPFNRNRFHYNWHYYWDYGNGDIGNQGVHQMDVARWGLGVTLPTKVMSMGGYFIFNDQKEVPNVINTTFEFPDAGLRGKQLVFDTRPYHTNDEKGAKVGIIFYGSEGYMVIPSYSKYQVYHQSNSGETEEPGPGRDEGGDHIQNFLDAVRARDQKKLNADVLEAHYSSALCHIGLISARLGRSLEFDPAKEQFIGDEEANRLVSREYRKPYVVPAKV